MGKYVVEDAVFDVLEDKTVLEEEYDIKDNILICEKTMHIVTRSSIYNYPDGFSLYLKFDDTGKQKLIHLTLAIYKSQVEKKLLECYDSVDLKINRYNNNFLAVTNDALNGAGTISFMCLTEQNEILKSEINYSKLEDLQVIDNQFVLVNCYENVDQDCKMWLIGVYDLNGRCKKVLLDKKIKNDEIYKTQVVVNKKGMLLVWVDRVKDGEEKKYTDFDLKIEAPNMPAPERKISWHEKMKLKKEQKEKKVKAKKMLEKQKEKIAEEELKKTESKKTKSEDKKTASKKQNKA